MRRSLTLAALTLAMLTTVAVAKQYRNADGSLTDGIAVESPNGSQVSATNPLPVGAQTATPLGFQQVTSLASAASLTVPAGATFIAVTAEGQSVRFRDDGVAPTSAVGYPLTVGATLIYKGSLTAIQFIQDSASATLDVLYYR